MELVLPSGTHATIAAGEDPDRGLVVIPDVWGLRPLFSDLCHALSARTGWTVVCPEPFPGQDLPGADDPDGVTARFAALGRLRDDDLLGDAAAAADATGCDRVGLIGFCMGGMYALLGADRGRFDRIVSFYGMITVPADWQGPGHGEPLHAVARRNHTEVLAIIGSEDEWTPVDQVDRLEAAGARVVRYEGAGHGFVHDPSRPAHRPDDAADAWDRALAFLAGV
ncbi:MAG: dienelactone hydrolase family protein [Acidobacteria bacterium]|nr:dienelactone hydrolase family protein [Acidobacteriota bacterium]